MQNHTRHINHSQHRCSRTSFEQQTCPRHTQLTWRPTQLPTPLIQRAFKTLAAPAVRLLQIMQTITITRIIIMITIIIAIAITVTTFPIIIRVVTTIVVVKLVILQKAITPRQVPMASHSFYTPDPLLRCI